MASTANDIACLLNLGHADSSALANVFSDYFGDNEDSGSEDQEDSEIWETDPNQGKQDVYHMHICIYVYTDHFTNSHTLSENPVDTEGKLKSKQTCKIATESMMCINIRRRGTPQLCVH